MIAIITRCRNRLEYTAQVVACVKNKSEGEDYRHIIVDNGSNDGTFEWFQWLHLNCPWYNRLIYVRNKRNSGDWGGMRIGFGVFPDADYYVQLDNDILVTKGWLEAMREVLDGTDNKIVMLRRANVAWKLKPLSPVKKVGRNNIVRIERAVACYMVKAETMKMFVNGIPESHGMRSKYIMAKKVQGKIAKIWNMNCYEIEADFQRQKYSPKNGLIWEKV